jgi:hypothetical protein
MRQTTSAQILHSRVRQGESQRFSQLLVNVGLSGNTLRGFALDFRLDRF